MLAEHRIRTLARQLGQILSVYAESFDAWCGNPSDVSLYDRAHSNLDLVRLLTGKTFPGGRGELGELLLYHADLKTQVLRHHIARSGGEALRPGDDDHLRHLRSRHAAMVAALQALCRQCGGAIAPTSAPPESSAVEVHLLGRQYPIADA